MDPLTHSVTGICLARAGLSRKLPQAYWVLLLAANAPDIDVVASAGGSLSYLNYHRHLTHSLPLMPVIALAVVVVVRLFSRRPMPWVRALAATFAGLLSHLLLDWTNIYGVRLLLPFSAKWYQLDLTSVIDLWIWAAAALALLGPLVARLVGSEIGAAPRGTFPGRGFAIFFLVFLLLYNCGRAALHTRAVAVLDSRIYDGEPPLRVAALPGPANPFHWRGLVETSSAYSVHDLNLLRDFDPGQARIFYKPEPSPAIAAARHAEPVRDFLAFAQYPFWRVLPAAEAENATRVEVLDLRFGTPSEPAFIATAIVNSRMDVIRSWFTFGRARPR